MIPFENEQHHDSPLSPDVVSGFILACNNIARYGINSQMNAWSFVNVSIRDSELQVETRSLSEIDVTHSDSGPINAPGYEYTKGGMRKARVLTPTETGQPPVAELFDEEIQIKIVCQNKFYDLEAGLATLVDIISTPTGRIFGITKSTETQESGISHTNPPEEIKHDWEVQNMTNGLNDFEKALRSAYPHVAQWQPE